GVIGLIVGAILYWVNKGLVLSSKISLLAGALLGLAYLIYFLVEQREFFTRRATKSGLNALALILIFLGILVVVNFISARHKFAFDTTANKAYSLADQTRKELKNLKMDINIYLFTGKGDPRVEQTGERIMELLGRYSYYSPKIHIYRVDIEREPHKAREFGVKSYNTVVVAAGERREKIENMVTEESLTNAIIRATKTTKPKVYFVKGKGERSPYSTDKDGYSELTKLLTDENFIVDTLFFLYAGKVPDDASLVVIAAPQYDYTTAELKKLDEYLENGGKLLVLFEPGDLDTLANWLSNYGIKVNDDIVVDVSGAGILFGTNELMPIVGSYDAFSPITKDFNVATLFPTTRSLKKADDTKGYSVVELARTSPQSWGEIDYRTKKIAMDKGKDTPGPVAVAVSAQKLSTEKKETRIVAFGDADFPSNTYYKFSGNKDLFMNSISWLVLEEERIGIRPVEEEDRRITLTARTQKLILYLLIVILPACALLTSGIVWWRRRG
ncbi:MAG: GldG family protein, partial [bacterium]